MIHAYIGYRLRAASLVQQLYSRYWFCSGFALNHSSWPRLFPLVARSETMRFFKQIMGNIAQSSRDGRD